MIIQFAANLLNSETDEEFMIVADTAQEAESLGAQYVREQAKKGVTLELTVGRLDGVTSHPTGQVVTLSKV